LVWGILDKNWAVLSEGVYKVLTAARVWQSPRLYLVNEAVSGRGEGNTSRPLGEPQVGHNTQDQQNGCYSFVLHPKYSGKNRTIGKPGKYKKEIPDPTGDMR